MFKIRCPDWLDLTVAVKFEILLRLLAKRGKDFPSQVCLESLAEEILPGEFARAAGANLKLPSKAGQAKRQPH
jgi:hypothetical protein